MASAVPPAYTAELEEWQTKRIADLTSPEGWLALVGLFWLQPGENRLVLASPSAAETGAPGLPPGTIELPRPSGFAQDGAVGTLVVEAGVEKAGEAEGGVTWRARFVPALGATVTVAQSKVPLASEIELPFENEDEPTVLGVGSLRFYAIERGGELALRVRDLESARRAYVTEIPRFAVDPSWRRVGRFEAAAQPGEIAVPNATGRDYPQETVGHVVFERDGTEYRLVALGGDVKEPLLLVVGDQTNGEETYPGGRYLYVDVGEGGRVEFDFNRLYNPPCVFSPHATCPLPPRGNRLALRIEAGEKWVHLPDMH